VRAEAHRLGLMVADKADSQEICFVPDGDYATFVESRAATVRHGAIVNERGEQLATHAGVHRFTIGQRKGLGIAAQTPMYVLKIDAGRSEVTVGPRGSLERVDFTASGVNWIAGTVVVAGTLATAGLLLESVMTAPPSGAATLNTTVALDGLPPTTVEGFVDMVESVAGGGGSCGVKLRTVDQAPGWPTELIPRTRQNCVVVARLVVAYIDVVTFCSRTSGAEKALLLAIWIVYDTALDASLQSNVIGCCGVSPLGGASRLGAGGSAGGAGGVELVRPIAIFVTNASPQKIDVSPLKTVSNAPVVAGKSRESVWPVTNTSPTLSIDRSVPLSDCTPPR